MGQVIFWIFILLISAVLLFFPKDQKTLQKDVLKKILLTGAQLFLSYIKYCFLVAMLLVLLFGGAFILISVFENFDSLARLFGGLPFLETLLENENIGGSFTLDTADFMKIFYFISLVVMVVTQGIHLIIKKVFKKELKVSYKKKRLISVLLISLLFVIDFVIVFIDKDIPRVFYWIFIILYFLILLFTFLFWGLSSLISKINKRHYENIF